jgi:hypothetical protein
LDRHLRSLKIFSLAKYQWLTPIILATKAAETRRRAVRNQPGQIVCERDPVSKNPIKNIGLVKWLKVRALSSSHNTAKKKKKDCFLAIIKLISIVFLVL